MSPLEVWFGVRSVDKYRLDPLHKIGIPEP